MAAGCSTIPMKYKSQTTVGSLGLSTTKIMNSIMEYKNKGQGKMPSASEAEKIFFDKVINLYFLKIEELHKEYKKSKIDTSKIKIIEPSKLLAAKRKNYPMRYKFAKEALEELNKFFEKFGQITSLAEKSSKIKKIRVDGKIVIQIEPQFEKELRDKFFSDKKPLAEMQLEIQEMSEILKNINTNAGVAFKIIRSDLLKIGKEKPQKSIDLPDDIEFVRS